MMEEALTSGLKAWLWVAKSGKKTCTEWENRPENDRKYKKGGKFRLFCGFLLFFAVL
ncbi:hypothetical protein [Desulfovibrio sp. QI0442]